MHAQQKMAKHQPVAECNVKNEENDDGIGNNNMDLRSRRGLELEYEIQFFEFSPKAFTDSLFNIILDSIKAAAIKLKVTLRRECPRADPEMIEKGAMKWQVQLESNTGRIFEQFEKFAIEKIFHIPNYILLPEDEIHAGKELTPAEEEALDREIEELEQYYISLREYNENLKQELDAQNAIMKRFGEPVARLERARASIATEEEEINERLDQLRHWRSHSTE